MFVLNISLGILLAYIYPQLGLWLKPEITSSWIAVVIIFLMSGLSLKTAEIKKAVSKVGFNTFVQVFNMGFVPSVTFGVSRLLKYTGALSPDLADGLVVTACLPMTVNMVIVQTRAAGGDTACALLNATLGNLLGVFLTPALILAFLD
jgi:sodium/bile acid cotransporter 7